MSGVLSHRSAAQYWGWAQKTVPRKAEVTVRRTRRLSVGARRPVLPHWADIPPDDVIGMVTSPRRTLVDCMRNLPLDESLPIVNSAIRADDFTQDEVKIIAQATRGARPTRGSARWRTAATGQAANPFESVLHAQALLRTRAQRRHPSSESLCARVGPRTAPVHDLGGPVRRRIVRSRLEGFESHGNPAQLTRDCRRYNLLTHVGMVRSIRFSWLLVMHHPSYVHRTLFGGGRARVTEHANVASVMRWATPLGARWQHSRVLRPLLAGLSVPPSATS